MSTFQINSHTDQQNGTNREKKIDVDDPVNRAQNEWELRVKALSLYICSFKGNGNVPKGGFCIVLVM